MCYVPEKYRLLSVLMPIYNEARTLRAIVRSVLAAPCPMPIELICVDDGSSDRTPAILAELAAADPRVRWFRHPQNRGKGAAVRTAIEHMAGDLALVQDADLEYDPADYPALLAPILEGHADAVFGSRFIFGHERKVGRFWHTQANRCLTLISNVLNGMNLTDMETCYKVVRSDILRQIPLRSDRFGIEPELTTRLAQWGIRLYEVPISYHGRSAAEGKKIGWRDAVAALFLLLRLRFIDTVFTTNQGYYMMRSLSQAKRLNRWMFRHFAPYVGERVLEAGCGIGNCTELLLEKERLLCFDSDPFYAEMIARRFGHLENVSTMCLDLDGDGWVKTAQAENIDTVIALNVLEHVENDAAALSRAYAALRAGGHAIVLVPNNPRLMGACDEALGHRRRHTAADLRAKLGAAGFEVVCLRSQNRLAGLAWMLAKLSGRRRVSGSAIRLYGRLLPLVRLWDVLHLGPALSLLAVGRKPA